MKGIISTSAIGFLLGLWITDWSMATAIATVNGILGGLLISYLLIWYYMKKER